MPAAAGPLFGPCGRPCIEPITCGSSTRLALLAFPAGSQRRVRATYATAVIHAVAGERIAQILVASLISTNCACASRAHATVARQEAANGATAGADIVAAGSSTPAGPTQTGIREIGDAVATERAADLTAGRGAKRGGRRSVDIRPGIRGWAYAVGLLGHAGSMAIATVSVGLPIAAALWLVDIIETIRVLHQADSGRV